VYRVCPNKKEASIIFLTVLTGERWIQRITFAAATNAADTHTA